MFLNELNKNEAIAFVNLVSQFANIDNNFAKEEKEVIKDYLKELSLNKDEVGSESLEEVLSTLKLSEDRIKRIMYFELVGLALVDDEYEERESDFLDNMAKELNISRSQRISIANFFYNHADIYSLKAIKDEQKKKSLKEQAEKLFI